MQEKMKTAVNVYWSGQAAVASLEATDADYDATPVALKSKLLGSEKTSTLHERGHVASLLVAETGDRHDYCYCRFKWCRGTWEARYYESSGVVPPPDMILSRFQP
jgi:hypothetical protein